MKTLNLEQMGVQEMDAVEIKSVDGGMYVILATNVLFGLALYGAFMAGYNAVQAN